MNFKFKIPVFGWRKPLMAGLAAVLVLLLASGAYWGWNFFTAKTKGSTVAVSADRLNAGGGALKEGLKSGLPVRLDVLFSMAPFKKVPLKKTNAPLFLNAGIELELASPAIRSELKKKSVALRNIVLSVLKEKTFVEIRSAKGKILLKHELMLKMNRVLENCGIKALYFTDFMVSG